MASANKTEDDARAAEQKALQEDIRALRADVAALAESIGRMAAGATAGAQAGMQPGLDGAGHAAQDFASDAEKLQADSIRAAEEAVNNAAALLASEVRRNPFTAIAAALCVGFIVGTTRRR